MTEEEINVLPIHKYKVASSQRYQQVIELCRVVGLSDRISSEGGLTTLVDMPLNSFPSTVAEEAFELKIWMFSTISFSFFTMEAA
ncbi:hypothetical protein ACSBR1_009834 [Camellia fascicularis]